MGTLFALDCFCSSIWRSRAAMRCSSRRVVSAYCCLSCSNCCCRETVCWASAGNSTHNKCTIKDTHCFVIVDLLPSVTGTETPFQFRGAENQQVCWDTPIQSLTNSAQTTYPASRSLEGNASHDRGVGPD